MGTITKFGARCRALMVEHGIETDKEMVERLRAAGHPVSIGSFSHWLHGKNRVPRWFCREFANMLVLSEPEKIRLGHAYAFGRDLPVGSR